MGDQSVSRVCLAALGVAVLALVVAAPTGASSWGESWLVEVPDSTVVVKGWRDAGLDYYAISLDGRNFLPARASDYTLKLRNREFDPRVAAAPAVDARLAAGDDVNLYIIQFVTQPLEAYRAHLRSLGVDIYKFLPYHSYVAHVPPGVRERVAEQPYVRWMGPYQPAYRTEPFVLAGLTAAEDELGTRPYNIMLFSHEMAVKERVAARIEAIGGEMLKVHDGKFLQVASLSRGQLLQVLRWDEVAHADRWSPLEPDMDIVREVGGANFLETVPGYTGQGVRGEVYDSGFNTSHVDFAASPLIEHTDVSPGSHGASTSGIIFGDGSGDPDGRGLMPDGQGIIGDYDVVGLDNAGPLRPHRGASRGALLRGLLVL